MSDNIQRFCKFCGEPVNYLEDFNDYFCTYCNSYQTTSSAIESKGKKGESIKTQIDTSLPPTQRPILPPEWRDNIPIFRHREYLIVQAFLSFGPKYTIYNVSGQIMGECRGRILSWGGEFDFFDAAGRHVAKVKGNPQFFKLQTKTWDIYDYQGVFKGAIKSQFGFLRRTWELYDEHGRLIARPDEQVWFKYNWRALDMQGRVLVTVDKQLFAFRDKFSVVVSEHIDPLIALAYAIAIDYMYFRGDKS